MLELRSIDAGYGRFQALFGVDLDVKAGEAVGVIGPNGAGKTTLMRVISGLIRPTKGSIAMQGVRQGDASVGTGTAFPQASLSFTGPDRALVLLDQRVDVSPLTMDGVVVRGLHVRQGNLEMHGGVASHTPWEDGLWPRGDHVVDLTWRSGSDDSRTRFAPSLAWMPDSRGRAPGVASLAVEHGTMDDPWRLRAELGWSGAPGAALDFDYRSERRLVSVRGAHRPAAFAALGVSRPPGTSLDAAWSERFGDRTELDASVSSNRLDLGARQPSATHARVELRHRAAASWTFNGGAGVGLFGDTDMAAIRRDTAWLGVRRDVEGFGVSGLYRYQRSTNAARAGHGARLSFNANRGPWRGNVFVDAQQQALTLDLLLREGSDLSRTFAELGLSATTPEDALRLVRDNAALFADQGVQVGALRTQPLRVQGGFDVAFQGGGPRAVRYGARFMADDMRGVDDRRRSLSATLSAGWRLFGSTEVELGYTRWMTRRTGGPGQQDGAFQVLLRTRLSGMQLPGWGRAISGRIVDDTRAGEAPLPLANVDVLLDGRVRTDGEGRYAFRSPGGGTHEVSAQLPARPGAYFTSQSTTAAQAGAKVNFSVSFAGARLAGTVRNDAGEPIAGVTVRLEGPTEATATTDSSGHYIFRSAAGHSIVSIVADSLPAGHDLSGLKREQRDLAPDAPTTADFVVRAQRSLRGEIVGHRGSPLTLIVEETGQSVPIDVSGRFALRSLPPGQVTLVVRGVRGETRRTIEVPAQAGAMPDVTLTSP